MSLLRAISKLTAPIDRRVRLLARRAMVKLIYDDPKMQELQLAVFSGEVHDHAERFQEYGFTSHPLPGAEAIVLGLGGIANHSVIIKVDDRRYRITGLSQGEVAIYTDEGDNITLLRGHLIEVNTETLRINADTLCEINAPTVQINAAGQCNIATPLVAASAALQAGANITDMAGAGGTTMAVIRSIYNGHRHPETGSTTNVPNQQM